MAKSILICDDAAFMRMMIKDILTKTGMQLQEKQKMEQKRLKSIMRQTGFSSYGYHNAGNGWNPGIKED